MRSDAIIPFRIFLLSFAFVGVTLSVVECFVVLPRSMILTSIATSINQQLTKDDFPLLSKGSRWIMVVDDEESIRLAVGEFLIDQGYRVTTYSDAPTALQQLYMLFDSTNKSVFPDAIVSDIRMPGSMDGLEFLKAIRANDKLVGIPFILLTAKGMTSDRIAGYKAGADAYLPKPFHPEELLSILDNVIQRRETISAENIAVDDLREEMNEIKKLVLAKTSITNRNKADNTVRRVDSSGRALCWNDVFLTLDEREVLELLSKGLTNKEMAKEMKLSQRRIEQLLTSMFRKTNAINRTELLRWAIATRNVKI
jgi:DNA-binding NarL/FixJ family response regulator